MLKEFIFTSMTMLAISRCRIIFLLWMILSPAIIFSQTLTVSNSQLNFGTVYENIPDSLPLTINNNLGYDVQVTGIRFYNTYNKPAFSASRDSFIVWNQSSETIWIKFSPKHNVLHNSELVIENNSHGGNVSVDLIGQGRYSKSYYDSSENKSDEDLKVALHAITSTGFISLGYNIARDSMFMIIDNKAVNGQGALQNTLECVYTGRNAVGYTDRTNCQTNNNFNTEHTFPQSLFTQAEPMRSDLYHLFPTDETANNIRGDDPFGVVSNPTWQNGGSKFANGVFEPRDLQKGRTARAMMYFVLRYQNYANFFTAQESILRTWHSTFLPSMEEITRNEKISTMQHNRNPFIDYPQFIERIQSLSATSVASVVHSADFTQAQIDFGYVTSSASHLYNYVIVNYGNQDIQFSNFNLNPSSVFNFVNGTGTNTILTAGESLSLNVELFTLPSGSINGTLQFNTNLPGQNSVAIPIIVSGSSPVGVAEPDTPDYCIYPNPSTRFLFINPPPDQLAICKVLDVAGREQKIRIIKYKEEMEIDVSELSPGFYVLQLMDGENTKVIRLSKQ